MRGSSKGFFDGVGKTASLNTNGRCPPEFCAADVMQRSTWQTNGAVKHKNFFIG